MLKKIFNYNSKFINMIHVQKTHFVDPEWRPKVITTKYYSEAGLQILRKKCDVTVCQTDDRKEFLEKVKGMDAILWFSFDSLDVEVLDAAGPQLRVISAVSVGLDHIDVAALKSRKIALGNTPTVLNDAVAEIAVGLAIAANRRFHEGRLQIQNNEWRLIPQQLIGNDWRNSTVGIVGFGGVGQTIAKRLNSFDVGRFLYCGHSEKPEAAEIGAKFVMYDELLVESDFIFIVCPLTNETRCMFDSRAFSMMKSNAVLVNVARGPLIDQNALYHALKNHLIFAAGLDVTDPEPLPGNNPLLGLSNCVITPHLGTATVNTRDNMSILAAWNALAGLSGQKMKSAVY